MYNGIGLTTPRGSGTNGYVQRNLSVLRVHETAAERAAAWDIAPPKHREPDEAILEHERKRKVEVKCLELQLKLEDDGLDEVDIENKVEELRTKLTADLASFSTSAKNLKPSDTHAIAAAKRAELDKMARALGTRRDYTEGEAFDREKQEEKKIHRLAEREERNRKREEESARMREQQQKWESDKRERDRLRRREEDRIRKERETNVLRRKERMPPPPVPSHRERTRELGSKGLSHARHNRGPRRSPRRDNHYGRKRSQSPYSRSPPPRRRSPSYERSQSRSRSPAPARYQRFGSPPLPSRGSPPPTPPHRMRERSDSPPRRRSHSPPPRRGRDRSESLPPRRGRDRSVSQLRRDRSPVEHGDDHRDERQGRELSRSPRLTGGRPRTRSSSAGSSMSVSTNRSRSSAGSD
ncbi:cwf21-domain-containing protein [Paxillus ammoniavirescens]|nr:cwf21-domain-containing protein [Paxillus ammoniavirescens]